MSFADFVDTQNVSIANTTDAVTYTQATKVRWNANPGKLTRRVRTDSVYENLWDPQMPFFEADIMVTQPQIAGLIALSVQTNNKLDEKTWTIVMTDEGATATTISGLAQLADLHFVDPGIGATTYHIRLEFASGGITVA